MADLLTVLSGQDATAVDTLMRAKEGGKTVSFTVPAYREGMSLNMESRANGKVESVLPSIDGRKVLVSVRDDYGRVQTFELKRIDMTSLIVR